MIWPQNLSQLEYPSSLEVNFEYNELNALHAIRDELNNVISGYVYDADGRLTKRMLENGLETIYEYNDAGWVTKIELREIATPANVLQRFEYGYDKVGNRLWLQYLDGRGDVYNYDANYQVIGVKYDVDDPTDGYDLATGAARTVTYAYDAVGNRMSMVDGPNTTTYTVNHLNEYASVGGINPVYSAEGYLVEYGDWTYDYDHAGNLTEASKLSGPTITYGYDAQGRRVSRSDGTDTVCYVYNGLNLIEERDEFGTVLAEYIYDGMLLPRKAIIRGNEYYFQQDVLGNVTALTDDQGDIVESYTYDVYGMPEVRDGSGNLLSEAMASFLFTGHYYDADIGIYITRYRAYSPELGRWMTRDPISFYGEDWNLYGYVLNNPMSFWDPYGLSFADGIVGFGDALSLGLTDWFREQTGLNDYVDKCSLGYQRGNIIGGYYDILNPKGWITGGYRMAMRNKPGGFGQFKGRDALRRENRQPRDAGKAEGLNRDQQRRLHDEITGQGIEDFNEIRNIAREIKNGQR